MTWRRALLLVPCCVAAALAALALLQWVTGGAALGTREESDWHWDKPAVVDGRTVHLTFEGGTCDARRQVVVDETDESVTLTVRILEERGACGGMGQMGLKLDATLRRPLGDRELIDGACLGGDEPLRGNCPKPVRTGTCGTATYRVDTPIDDRGDVTLRARVENAVPGETWRVRWTYRDYDDSRVENVRATVDGDGELTLTRAMGRLPAERYRLRQVELAPPGGAFCKVRGHMPMSYGS